MPCMPSGPRHVPHLLLVLALPACTAPHAVVQDRSRPPQQAAPEDHGTFGERILLEASAIPAAWLTRDLDGVRNNGDATTSSGFGLRLASGNRDQSIGVLWQSLYGDADGLDVDAIGLDVDVRTPIDDTRGRFYLRAGATLGGAWLDDRGGGDLEFQGAAQLRIGLDFQPTHFLQLSPSIGGVVFGHPGETEAYGAIFSLGCGLVF